MSPFCDDPSGNNAPSLPKFSYRSLIRGNSSRFPDTALPILRPQEFPCIVLLGDSPHWLPGTMERIHYRREEVSRSPHESPAYKNYFCLPVYMRIAFGYDGFILLFFRKIYSIQNRGQRVPLQSFLPALYNLLIRATGLRPLSFSQS